MFASAFSSHRSSLVTVGRRSLLPLLRRRDLSVSYSSVNNNDSNDTNGVNGKNDDDPNRIIREAKYKELMEATPLSLAPM
jgi:hypothetical protein